MARGSARRRHAASRRSPTRSKGGVPRSGVLRVGARGSGSVRTPEGTFYVSARGVREAMNGDTVQVRAVGPAPHGRSGQAGVVCGVLARATTTFAARYVRDGALRVLVPLDARLCHDFVVEADAGDGGDAGARDGDAVVARILAYPTRRSAGTAVVERVIGRMDEERLPIEMAIAAHDLATEFSAAALAQAEGVRPRVGETLASEPGRRDLRGRFVVTVDPADARDFDDAVSLAPLEGGGWLLGVHIADVSEYVPWGSPVDLDARARATSVYLPDRVLPMLPERLCDDVCSLVPGADRLAMTCDLTLDARGRVTHAEVYPSAIRSRARLSYDEVDTMLETGEGPVVEGVSLPELFARLDRVRELRRCLRERRGAIEFVSTETRAVLDEDGHAVDVRLRRRTRATDLIEEAMLAANEAVARRLERLKLPAPFRVHEPPAADALGDLVERLRPVVGVDAATRAGVLLGEPAALQRVLALAAKGGEDVALVVSSVMLRAMRKAVYAPENRGHFGLAAPSYCHFTSPIRRYPDLMVHRALKAAHARGAGRDLLVEMRRALPEVCRHSSKMERVAAEASAQSQAAKLAEYLGDRIGATYGGVVSEVAPYGLFVRLDGVGIQGLARVGGPDSDGCDETAGELVDPSGERWRLGQRVRVRVRSVDEMRGRVDLSLVE